MKKAMRFLYVLVTVYLFVGCATSVPVQITRPAELDLHGAKTISVLPFQLSNEDNKESGNGGMTVIINISRFFDALKGPNPDEIASADYITSELMQNLSNSRYIQVVDSSAVQKALKDGTPVPVDVYLTGKILRFNSDISKSNRTETKDNTEYTVTYYTRNITVSVMYQIIDAKTNNIITYKIRDVTASSEESQYYSELQKPFDIIRPKLRRLTGQIMKELQPYEEVKYISMMTDKTKNPDMKVADDLVKSGLLQEAEEKYLSLYKSKNSFVAGYNAGRLMQAEGKLQEAKELMEELVNTTGDKHAISALRDIDYDIRQAEKLRKQTASVQ